MGKSEVATDNNVGIKQSKRGMGWCEKYLRYLAAGKAKISGPALEHCADFINSAGDYIQQLESRLAQTERERDVMLVELKKVGCAVCKHSPYQDDFYIHNECHDCVRQCNFEWRGVCTENTKEE